MRCLPHIHPVVKAPRARPGWVKWPPLRQVQGLGPEGHWQGGIRISGSLAWPHPERGSPIPAPRTAPDTPSHSPLHPLEFCPRMDEKETRAVNRGREILRLGSLRCQEFLRGLTPQSYPPSPGLSRNKDKPPPQLAGLNKRGGQRDSECDITSLSLFAIFPNLYLAIFQRVSLQELLGHLSSGRTNTYRAPPTFNVCKRI